MNILITINKKYIKQVNILLNSIQYSNAKENFNIYILHKDLEEKDLKIIENNLDLNRFQIQLIHISEKEIQKFPVHEKRYPVEVYFRIFARDFPLSFIYPSANANVKSQDPIEPFAK